MTVLLANVYLTTSRPTYTASTKVTSGATPYLSQVLAHLEPNTPSMYVVLPDAAFKAAYYAVVESGTDIAPDDVITLITLLDGQTPWPGERITDLGTPGNQNVVWRVRYVRETAAALLPAREVWIDRADLSGPFHR